MELHYQTYPDSFFELSAIKKEELGIPVVIIPGLFGSTANWRSFAKKLSELCPVIVIDQRNHGRSPHLASNGYQDMVNDLYAFLEKHDLSRVRLCGHSMGGKVAMLFALQYPHIVEKLAVLDIAPVAYQHSHAPFLEELLKIDLSRLASRREADDALAPVISDTGTRLFLLQSLAGTAGAFFWRINLPVLHQFMPQLVGFPETAVDGLSYERDCVFISGGLSNYVKPDHHTIIRRYFKTAQFVIVPNAGHWLHAEQPEKVLDALTLWVKK